MDEDGKDGVKISVRNRSLQGGILVTGHWGSSAKEVKVFWGPEGVRGERWRLLIVAKEGHKRSKKSVGQGWGWTELGLEVMDARWYQTILHIDISKATQFHKEGTPDFIPRFPVLCSKSRYPVAVYPSNDILCANCVLPSPLLLFPYISLSYSNRYEFSLHLLLFVTLWVTKEKENHLGETWLFCHPSREEAQNPGRGEVGREVGVLKALQGLPFNCEGFSLTFKFSKSASLA